MYGTLPTPPTIPRPGRSHCRPCPNGRAHRCGCKFCINASEPATRAWRILGARTGGDCQIEGDAPAPASRWQDRRPWAERWPTPLPAMPACPAPPPNALGRGRQQAYPTGHSLAVAGLGPGETIGPPGLRTRARPGLNADLALIELDPAKGRGGLG